VYKAKNKQKLGMIARNDRT